MFKKLWNDESGAVLSIELVLVTSIVTIGAITGLSTLRDAVVTELADLSEAMAVLDQSYEIPGISSPVSYTAGSYFYDATDPGDEINAPPSPRGIVICSTAFNGQGSEGRGGFRGGSQPRG